MDAQTTLTPYIASSARVAIRPWYRRRDGNAFVCWPPYIPALPAHWLAAPPVPACCERMRYAVDLLAAPPADRLVGSVSLIVAAGIARLGIVLHPAQLGAGLGTEAMLLMPRVAAQLGASGIMLDVAAENTRARRCYNRAGWVETDRITRAGFAYVEMQREVAHASGHATASNGDLHPYGERTIGGAGLHADQA